MARLNIPPGLGRSFWFALLLLLGVELALHNDTVMHRYRSVFAVGRAMDKLHYVETQPPGVLFLGNSRTDNGIDPRAVSRVLGAPPPIALTWDCRVRTCWPGMAWSSG